MATRVSKNMTAKIQPVILPSELQLRSSSKMWSNCFVSIRWYPEPQQLPGDSFTHQSEYSFSPILHLNFEGARCPDKY